MLNKTNKLWALKVPFLVIALVLSLLYIWYDKINDYKRNLEINVAQTSYNKWMEVALWEIMRQAVDGKSCSKPINIWDDKTQVNLINIDCLKPKQPQVQPQLPVEKTEEEK